MNYIGSKKQLAPWIQKNIADTYHKNLSDSVFADIFAGTGQVAQYFKPFVKQVICNDLESYSFALNSHYIGNSHELDWPSIDKTPFNGIITQNFTPNHQMVRKYYTVENGMTIDGIRKSISDSLSSNLISLEQYHWALASLIEAADKVANTSSVYGAFLKNGPYNGFKETAIKPLDFYAVENVITEQNNLVFQGDANDVVKKISGDILYLDPPYNNRQYGANYHVLNHIVNWKSFSSDKLTGLTDYNKSDYCYQNKAEDAFDDLIANAEFSHIYVSYNNEGLISEERFKDILSKYGKYDVFKKEYKRFKANSSGDQPEKTYEYLHLLVK